MIGNNDAPSKKDKLEIGEYVDGLEKFINEVETPITIAIQGDWGSGKTTIMNFIYDKYEEQKEKQNINNKEECKCKIFPIKFNAWDFSQFNSDDDIKIALIKYLIYSLSNNDIDKMNNIVSGLFEGTKNVFSVLSNIIDDNHFLYKGLTKSLDWVALAFKKTEIQIFDELKSKLNKLVGENLIDDKKSRVVIFVDDLDRIEPAKAVGLLEIIKTLFQIEKVVFVVAIDYEIIKMGLNEKYKNITDDKVDKYFEKIIQVPFKVPMEKYQIGELIFNKSIFKGTNENNKRIIKEIIIKTIGNNPRSIIRLSNELELYRCIDIEENIFANEDKLLYLIIILCMQKSNKDMYSLCVKKLNLCVDESDEEKFDKFIDLLREYNNAPDLTSFLTKKINSIDSFRKFYDLISTVNITSVSREDILEMNFDDFLNKCEAESEMIVRELNDILDVGKNYRICNRKYKWRYDIYITNDYFQKDDFIYSLSMAFRFIYNEKKSIRLDVSIGGDKQEKRIEYFYNNFKLNNTEYENSKKKYVSSIVYRNIETFDIDSKEEWNKIKSIISTEFE